MNSSAVCVTVSVKCLGCVLELAPSESTEVCAQRRGDLGSAGFSLCTLCSELHWSSSVGLFQGKSVLILKLTPLIFYPHNRNASRHQRGLF